VLFGLGMASLCLVWFSGPLTLGRPCLTWKRVRVLSGEVVQVSRLFRISRQRWLAHALVVYPLGMRFIYGCAAGLLSFFRPGSPVTLALTDKNNVVPALFFDMTGGIMILGLVVMILGRKGRGQEGLSGADLSAPGPAIPMLLCLVLFSGFVLEGMRIAMTGWPAHAGWAVFGYGISLVFRGMTGLSDIYGWLWYLHGAMIAGTAALIPVTGLRHVITIPLALALEQLFEKKIN
jgi:hypothetical protein